jgi:hypothetical protein
VRVTFPGSGLVPQSGELVPDTCTEGTLRLAPPDPGLRRSATLAAQIQLLEGR